MLEHQNTDRKAHEMKDFDSIPTLMADLGKRAKAASADLAFASAERKHAALIAAADRAMAAWGKASAEDRVGVCLEILDRLKDNSFEMAHAVMQTTGQAFLMAFQAGGPHALDRDGE